MVKLTVHHRKRKRKAKVYHVASGDGRYMVLQIPKRGGFRTIYVPADNIKRSLKHFARQVAVGVDRSLHPAAHGFRPGRSVISNAKPHIGYDWTLCADLKDCFDHVTFSRVQDGFEKMPKARNAAVRNTLASGFVEGIARQGMPTSPVYCNIALYPLDCDIAARWPNVVYTRYADDLAFSANERSVLDEIRRELPKLAEQHGFEVHPKKWHLQWSRFGRRVICGVSVGEDSIRASRRSRRKLRAWQHRRPKSRRTKGLRRWVRGFDTYVSNWVMRSMKKL